MQTIQWMQSRSVLEALQQEEEWGKDRQSHFMVACEAVQVRRFAFGQMDLQGFFRGEELARDQEARARRVSSHRAEMGVWVTKRPGTRKCGSKSNLGQRLVIPECEVWGESELHKAWRQWKGAGRLGTWKVCVGHHCWRASLKRMPSPRERFRVGSSVHLD